MTNDELLAIRDLIRDELVTAENRIMDRVDEQIKISQTDTMKGAAILLDAQFSKQFNLLFERLDDGLRKMPSEEDMDIIDETLQEHEGEIKILRQDVNELKRAL